MLHLRNEPAGNKTRLHKDHHDEAILQVQKFIETNIEMRPCMPSVIPMSKHSGIFLEKLPALAHRNISSNFLSWAFFYLGFGAECIDGKIEGKLCWVK